MAGTLVLCVIIAVAVSQWSTVTAALHALTTARPGWLAIAAAVEAVSVLAIAQQHRVMLRAAGAKRPRLGDYLAVTYVGGALSGSLPGGPALAAAYVYRQLRTRDVAEGQAAWTLVASGVVSTTVILLISTTVLTLSGHLTTPRLFLAAAELAAGPALVALALWAARHPRPVIGFGSSVLAGVNRLRRSPVHTGQVRVEAVATALQDIQPRWWQWAASLACAAVNWSADAACLALCLVAVGLPMPALTVIVLAYVAGVAAIQLALTPSGLGVTEAAITAVLIAHGSPPHAALAGVLLFRLLSPGLNIAIGAVLGLTRPPRIPVSGKRGFPLATQTRGGLPATLTTNAHHKRQRGRRR